ncbi:MAG: L-lactate permease [Bellilinea sp.]|jgi:lactate permease
MELTLLNWMLALLPVLVVLVLMLVLRWGGSRAGAAGWIAAVLIAALFFAAGPRLIAYSQAKAVLLSLDVLFIIWTALLLFHAADEAGAVRVIGVSLPRLTGDRTMQGLLIGWLFASFLQGMGGFGVPVAVAAPLLVGLGFNPVQAVVMACVGHGWAVNYGSLATSFQTLMAVTGLPGELLAHDSAWLLGISCYACGLIVALVAGGWRGALRSLPAVIVLGSVMAISQYALAVGGLWNLGATGSSMLGLLAGIALCRLPLYRGEARAAAPAPIPNRIEINPNGKAAPPRSLKIALSAYVVLVALTFAVNLIPPLNALLDRVQLNLYFPELVSGLGWVTPAGAGRAISLFGHTGSILLYASLAAYGIYHRAGYYSPGAAARIMDKTVKGAVNSSLGILAMVGMAVVMSHAGMTNLLALGMSQSFGPAAYPLIAPFIGALGAFITGSNNNSNVLFAVLQMRTAELLGLSVPLILGGQTAGGSLGSIMAPAKVIVGCSTVGLSDREGEVIGQVIRYGLAPIALVALAAWLAA